MLVRLYHLGDVSSSHHNARHLAFLVADGVHHHFVVHLVAEVHFRHMFLQRLALLGIDDRRELYAVCFPVVDAVVDRDVPEVHLAPQQGLAVLHAEGLAGLLVDVYHSAVGVVGQHVHQRVVEHGVVSQHQFLGVLRRGLRLGDVVLDAEND